MRRRMIIALLSPATALAGDPTSMQCDFAVHEKQTGITYVEKRVGRLQADPDGAFAALYLELRQLAMRGQVSLRAQSTGTPRFDLFIYEDDYMTRLGGSQADGHEASVEWESKDRKASIHCRLQ